MADRRPLPWAHASGDVDGHPTGALCRGDVGGVVEAAVIDYDDGSRVLLGIQILDGALQRPRQPSGLIPGRYQHFEMTWIAAQDYWEFRTRQLFGELAIFVFIYPCSDDN